MTGFAKRAAVEPRLLAPEVTAVGASQGVKYPVAVSIEFSHLSERNFAKIFHSADEQTLVVSIGCVVFGLGLKIRVSVVRFRPWPPSNPLGCPTFHFSPAY